jgi:hypothetical protein
MSDRRSHGSLAEAVALETWGPDAVPVALSANGVAHVVPFESLCRCAAYPNISAAHGGDGPASR